MASVAVDRRRGEALHRAPGRHGGRDRGPVRRDAGRPGRRQPFGQPELHHRRPAAGHPRPRPRGRPRIAGPAAAAGEPGRLVGVRSCRHRPSGGFLAGRPSPPRRWSRSPPPRLGARTSRLGCWPTRPGWRLRPAVPTAGRGPRDLGRPARSGGLGGVGMAGPRRLPDRRGRQWPRSGAGQPPPSSATTCSACPRTLDVPPAQRLTSRWKPPIWPTSLRQAHGNVANAVGGYYQGLTSLLKHGPLPSARWYVSLVGRLWNQFHSG